MPTGTPSAGPTRSPTPYVPELIKGELDFSDLSVHMILIMVATIFACIFLAYLSVHLARKYHPEWFKRKKKKKKAKGKSSKKKEKEKEKEKEEKKVISSKQLTSIAPDPSEMVTETVEEQDLAISKTEMGAEPDTPGSGPLGS